MTTQVTHNKDAMIAYTNAEGLKVIREKAEINGYKIVKIDDDDHKGYIVTIKKIKKLVKYDPIKES